MRDDVVLVVCVTCNIMVCLIGGVYGPGRYGMRQCAMESRSNIIDLQQQ